MIRFLLLRSLVSTLFLLCAGAGAAHANAPLPEAPAHLSIEAPAGWDLLPGLSDKVARTAMESSPLGDEPTQGGALAFGRANRGVLYLTWTDTLRAIPNPEAIIRQGFDGLHQAPYLASPEAGSTQEIAYRERSFDGAAELHFEWAHMSNGTVNIVRALAWKDDDARVHLAIAECVLPSETIGEARPTCEKSLSSLHLAQNVEPVALASLAEPGPVGPTAQDYVVPKLGSDDSPKLPGPSLNTPPVTPGEVLYEGRKAGGDDNNNRLLIGVGILLLGAAFWLTTRSRPGASLESPDESTEPGEPDETDESEQEKSK